MTLRRPLRLILLGLVLLALLTMAWVGGQMRAETPAEDTPEYGTIVGEEERVRIWAAGGEEGIEQVAKIDTGATFTSIDDDLARELGVDLEGAEIAVIRSAMGKEYRPLVPVRLEVAGETIDTKATVSSRDGMENQVLVGRRDLGGFLIRVGSENE